MRELFEGRNFVTLSAISILLAILVSACSRHENNMVGAAFIEDEADGRAVRDSTLTPPDSTVDFQLDTPAENIGSSSTLLVGERPSLGYLARGLMRFDGALLPDSGTVILEASIEMKYRGGRRDMDPPFTMTLHRVTSDWEEDDWDAPTDSVPPDPAFPPFPFFDGAFDTLDLGSPADGDTVAILATELVRRWVDHPDSNFGLALAPGTGVGSMLEFDTSEAILSEPPRLTYRFVSTAGDTVEVIPRLPVADTFVLEKTGSFVSPIGQTGLLTIGRGFPSRTLMKFSAMDSLPVFDSRATVNRAQLTLSLDGASSDFTSTDGRKMIVQLHRVTSDTWLVDSLEVSTTLTAQEIGSDDTQVVFEVVELVEQMRQEGNRGFFLRMTEERPNVDIIRFHGADASLPELRPTLRIWWTPGG